MSRWQGVAKCKSQKYAFRVVVLLVVYLSGCSDASATAVQQVLSSDTAASTAMQQEIKAGVNHLVAVHRMVTTLDQIDLQGAPADFSEAYIRHRGAWRSFYMQLQSEPQGVVEGLVTGALNRLGGEFDGGYSRMVQGRTSRYAEVVATWTEVEAASARHGVSIKK